MKRKDNKYGASTQIFVSSLLRELFFNYLALKIAPRVENNDSFYSSDGKKRQPADLKANVHVHVRNCSKSKL